MGARSASVTSIWKEIEKNILLGLSALILGSGQDYASTTVHANLYFGGTDVPDKVEVLGDVDMAMPVRTTQRTMKLSTTTMPLKRHDIGIVRAGRRFRSRYCPMPLYRYPTFNDLLTFDDSRRLNS